MKIFKYSLITFLSIAIISNLVIINTVILQALDQNHFRYSNQNASFTDVETFNFKDPYISNTPIDRFIAETNPAVENKTIYRLYRINPLCFWRWSYYLFTSRDFSYKTWSEIEQKRVPYDPNNMWQKF